MKDKKDISSDRLISRYLPADYFDSTSRNVRPEDRINVDRLFALMFEDFPWPVQCIFTLRDTMVKPFGLKGGTAFREHIINRNDNEILVGMDDSHLEYAVSLYVAHGEMAEVSTAVRFHNVLGRVYFALIWCFHKILVTSQFRRAMKKIRKDALPERKSAK